MTLHFFGGKGGVGKTTCAAAFSLLARRRHKAASVLVVSTDPAHSLADAYGVRLTSRITSVRPRLDAVQLDARRAFARWMTERHAAAADVLEHGTWLDREDVEDLLELPIPGVDELVALTEIDRLARLRPRAGMRTRKREGADAAGGSRRSYDVVIVDTAPTGHTLRLLAAPDAVRAVAAVLDAMQAQHRLVRQQFARVGRPEAADRLIEEIAEQAAASANRLRDSRRTVMSWVTLPEPMSLAESQDALAALDAVGVRIREVIVNRVLTDEGPCRMCDRRRAEERAVIARIRRTIGRGRSVRLLPALDQEPTGVRALAALAQSMANGSGLMADGRRRHRSMAYTSISPEPSAISHGPASLSAIRGAKLLFIGGKGGVGKTTVAGAIALCVAREKRRRRVLLLSTDPAHSLADVFESTGGDAPTRVANGPSNLFVREVDAPAALARHRRSIEAALGDISASMGAPAAGAQGSDLIELAPPGIDELFGLLSVFEARADYDVIVVDTAPTGHALRLLEMPDTARTWIQALLRVLLKYRSLVRPGQLAGELVALAKSIREFEALLHDAAVSRVLVVTRAAQLPRRETERLLIELKRLRLAVPALIVNALTLDPRTCRRCRATAAAEQRELAALRRVAGRRGIIRAPLAAPAPRRVRGLERWARTWLV